MANFFEESIRTYSGLSSETKPTTAAGNSVPNGSRWREVDTGKTYHYNEFDDTWYSTGLPLDSNSRAVEFIDYAHHEIHGGSTFRAQHNIDAIEATGDGGELVIAFFVPDQTKEPHMIWEFVHQGSMTMKVLEGVTLTLGNGTDVSCKNSNRNSTNTSVLQGVGTGALASGYVTVGDNDDAIYAGGSTISLKRNYVSKNEGSSGARRAEVVLKTNTYYAFTLANNETSTQGGQVRLEWYEHEDKS